MANMAEKEKDKSKEKRVRSKIGFKKSQPEWGKWGIFALLLVTSLISLALYLKQSLAGGVKINLPGFGTERVTFTK